MPNILIFSIFVYCFQVCISQRNVGNIGCYQQLHSFENRCKGQGCRGRCANSCIAVERKIWGTGIYTYDSPVCRAALHDLRISSWNESARDVEFQFLDDTRVYVGSVRQNIKTLDYGKLTYPSDGCYFFKSPRITEEILDIITLHHKYFVEDGGSHTLECRVSSNAVGKKIYFSKFLTSEKFEEPPKRRGSQIYYTHSWDNKGSYWCKPERSMLSDVLSVAMQKYPQFLPNEITITKSIGDATEINMKPFSNSYSGSRYWRKNEELFSDYLNRFFGRAKTNSKIKFGSLIIGDAGFYSLDNDYYSINNPGITRLIIRVCKDGMFGPLCEHECPNCLNGGVCHDLTGDCICPPGFNGTLCENACKPGFFGRDCSQQCYNELNDTTNCAEILFCLPDPYGCSCISGFTSIFCNQTCDSGYYGAGCTQKCSNCKDSETCEVQTGKCPDGCKEGWHGTPCVLSYPAFKNAPTVESVTSNSIELSFEEWEESKDNGSGIPDYYIIQYKLNEPRGSEWKNAEEIKANSSFGKNYTAVLKNLQYDTTYSARIIVKDVSGHTRLNDVPTSQSTTLCGVPEELPRNININNTTSTRIIINWNLPPSNTWKCKYITVNVFYNSTNGDNSSENATNTNFTIDTKPFTEWNIALRVINKDFAGEWTSLLNAISAQDAPSKVENVNLIDVTDYWIHLAWDKPREENGIIIKYIIRYRQEKWLHSCYDINRTILRKEIDGNETSAIIETYPNSKYVISISAETVKRGNETSVQAKTKESAPGGPPQNLRNTSIENNYVLMQWESPLCNLTYGKITEYRYSLKSLDPWDEEEKSGESSELYTYVYKLTPFTFYTGRVYAGTKVGFSNYSAGINFTTKSAVPPAPTNLTIYVSTESILSISWIPPHPPYGILEKYSVKYHCLRNRNCNSQKSVTVTPDQVKCFNEIRENQHCYTLTGLMGDQTYKIEITAYNENVYGASNAATVSGETKESVPDPPEKAEAIHVTEHSVDIKWFLPSKPNGNLTGYRINITAADSYNSSFIGSAQWNVTDSNTMNREFFNLHSATTYNVTVEARTKIGYGKPYWFQFTTNVSEPVIDFEPIIGNVTDTTVDIIVKPITFDGPISAYFVMVEKEKRREKRVVSMEELRSFNESSERYVAAKLYPQEINSTGRSFTIGDGKHYNGYYNAPLNTGDKYKVGLAVLSEFKGEERIGYKYLTEAVTVKKPDDSALVRSNLPGIIIGVIVCLTIIILTVIFIKYRYPKLFKYASTMKDLDIRNSVKDRQSVTLTTEYFEESAELETMETKNQKIPVNELEIFVQTTLRNGTLRKQFVSVEKGQNKPWDAAKLPENKMKNRYGNLLPYDSTRVILEKIPNDPYSDYINANYIDGYKAPKKYIATQGPKPLTVNDFWRMIWQEKVCKIVISTNLVENGKTKCEKYWTDTTETYGSVTLKLLSTEMFADYVIRTFNISKQSEVREIKQFHFTTWPDHGVPMYAVAVSNFLVKTRIYKPESKSPIVFHCSAGIGRTGTLILIDSMLDMAAAENHIDPLSQLYIMRQQRINMVETLDQYYHACQCLIEALCSESTSIVCSEFIPTLNRLKVVDSDTGHTGFHVQFEKLSKVCPLLNTTDCRTALDPSNQGKNRSDKILPPDRSRPILKIIQGNPESSYINAVFVNGYKQKDAFLVTQIPLPETMPDFWRMAFSAKTSTIVLLNDLDSIDETCLPYWPENEETYCDVEVRKTSEEKHGDIIIRNFELKNISTQEEAVTKVMKQFHLTGWPSSSSLPSSADVLLNLIEKVERWQQNSGTTTVIVQCLNGARACGLYCSSVFICDKIKCEQEVDVFFAVRSIRTNRPQFIEDVGQYIYCHQVALTYLDSFETYANFQ